MIGDSQSLGLRAMGGAFRRSVMGNTTDFGSGASATGARTKTFRLIARKKISSSSSARELDEPPFQLSGEALKVLGVGNAPPTPLEKRVRMHHFIFLR